MITQKIEAKLQFENIDIFDGVRLSEANVEHYDYDFRVLLTRALLREPEGLFVFSRNKNLMSNRLAPLKAKRVAKESFNNIHIINEIVVDDYTYLLFKIDSCSTNMLLNYRRDFWVLEGASPSFDITKLSEVFSHLELERQVECLLSNYKSCSRLWKELPNNHVQIFYPKNELEEDEQEKGQKVCRAR